MEAMIDINSVTRICSTCKVPKKLNEFGNKAPKAGYKYNKDSVCLSCKKDYEHNRVMLNPDKKAQKYSKAKIYAKLNKGRFDHYRFKSKWKKILGEEFTRDDYDKLLNTQDGKCAICNGVEIIKGKKISLSVDHCHTTLRVRGLLCGNCNRAIGLLKDNPELLLKASLYLKDY